jgi:hypothetical protein
MDADELANRLARAFAQLAEALRGERPTGLPPIQRAILDTLTHQPQTAKQLARKVRRRYNSSFRAALARLVEAGLARHTPQGYSLP